MINGLEMKMYSFTLDCIDHNELAEFYAALLGWSVVFIDENFASVGAPNMAQGEYPGITFQRNTEYKPPVWPDKNGAQQQMAHLDIAVNGLKKSVEHAVQCGATVANEQFSDDWTVMLDPAGHPFCLCLIKQIFTAEE